MNNERSGFQNARKFPGGTLVQTLSWVFFTPNILLFGAEFIQVWVRHKGRDILAAERAYRLKPAIEAPAPESTSDLIRIQFLDHSRGHAGEDDVVSEAFGDHGTGSDYDIVPQHDSRTDDGVTADPAIVAYRDGSSKLRSRTSELAVKRVSGRINAHIWSNMTVLPYADFANIEDGEIEVRVKVLAEIDVRSVVALEVSLNRNFAGTIAQQLRKNKAIRIIVIDFAEALGTRPLRHQFEVTRLIEFTAQHLFLFGHKESVAFHD
jgi:hypothetical protein